MLRLWWRMLRSSLVFHNEYVCREDLVPLANSPEIQHQCVICITPLHHECYYRTVIVLIEKYVGETGRTLATRTKDHTSHNIQPTAVGDHCREHGHVISKNNVEMLASEEGWFKRKVREAIEIKTPQPTINRDQGFDLPAIYSEILPVTCDRSRQTSGHPALTIGAVASSSLTK